MNIVSWSKEPALINSAIAAVLALIIAFGAPITNEQRDAVLACTGVIVLIIFGQGVATRAAVYSRDSARKLVAATLASTRPGGPPPPEV